MATITLTFDLFEEKNEAENALKADSLRLILNEILNDLRSCYKYNVSILKFGEQASGEEMEFAETLAKKIHQIAISNSINLLE